MTSSHRVRVLGKEVHVRSTASAEQVQEIESFVNNTIAELQAAMKTSDPQIIAIMALLNLAESCLQQSRDENGFRRMASERISRLLSLIEEAAPRG